MDVSDLGTGRTLTSSVPVTGTTTTNAVTATDGSSATGWRLGISSSLSTGHTLSLWVMCGS
jgi:hypothetical protein